MLSPIVKTPVRSWLLGAVLEYHGSCTATNSHLQCPGGLQHQAAANSCCTGADIGPHLPEGAVPALHGAERMSLWCNVQVVQGPWCKAEMV